MATDTLLFECVSGILYFMHAGVIQGVLQCYLCCSPYMYAYQNIYLYRRLGLVCVHEMYGHEIREEIHHTVHTYIHTYMYVHVHMTYIHT